ncbi:hypothetical protein CANINC_003621 [Pichia inconspicua]|uniref:ubiquitinyl hydrolase 1 n=1 Tax=Pichia inconspicua TaxID=52247 RepID=A0A4T0WYB8_9ASCO|nr:hypothetical protein CANINC_003621 [[Candida] inconspicua]
MFKRLRGKSKGKETDVKAGVSNGESVEHEEEVKQQIPLKVKSFTEDEKAELEKVISNDSKFPWGDGSDKLFGIENYGYICYISSIFQCLYHTGEFRRAILAIGEGDKIRKRKYSVPGVNKDKISKNISCGEDGVVYKVKDFGVGSCEDNEVAEYIREFPKLNELGCGFSINSQRNLTLVGIMKDKNATLEWRKKAALINGPVINLDYSLAEEYGFKDDNIFTVMKGAFECINESYSKTGVLSPYRLVEVIKRENIMFRNMQHQDAHEFLNFLLNKLIEESNELREFFEGELISETKCLTCDSGSFRREKFLDLSVDLEQDSSIANSVRLFSKVELLSGNNKFYCEKCYGYEEAAKRIKVTKLPKILAFHLKRFKYSESAGKMVKLFYRVEYVKTLRIEVENELDVVNNNNNSDKLYELYGVVVHIGSGPYHGHYIALIKSENYGWLLFDDETIEKISEDYVYGFFGDGCGLSTAYILFYREVGNESEFYARELY